MIKVGEHVTLDFLGVKQHYSSSFYNKVIYKIAKKAKVEILNVSEHKFQPQGYTLVALIAESHMSFHTFGLGQVEWIRESFLWIVLKEPYSCAILAFTLNTGAYSSEIFRSAFETINKGVLEAAESLGLNKINTFFKVKLPIAIRQSLPAYGNEMILMLKGTSLASTVTLLDLTGVAKHIISTTFRPVEVFIVAGSIYLLMTFIIHNFVKFLEKKYDYS